MGISMHQNCFTFQGGQNQLRRSQKHLKCMLNVCECLLHVPSYSRPYSNCLCQLMILFSFNECICLGVNLQVHLVRFPPLLRMENLSVPRIQMALIAQYSVRRDMKLQKVQSRISTALLKMVCGCHLSQQTGQIVLVSAEH